MTQPLEFRSAQAQQERFCISEWGISPHAVKLQGNTNW